MAKTREDKNVTDIEADLLIAQAEIKSLKGEIEKLKAAVKVLDEICINCSWETGSKECLESGCPIAQWRKMEG
jgi:hypothetical protein